MSERSTNALINESSPYLLQHAHNPVDWKPYNQKTLDIAKEAGKPILISIGYSACHWCHVMEKESFEDEAVAAYMNAHFTCIKVDREERPDVDQIYMSAVQMITGRGGWPLNCFALPDGRPFHGGTYFPKPNWLGLLQTVYQEFTDNRSKLEGYAGQLMAGLEAMANPAIEQSDAGKAPSVDLRELVSGWKSSFDWEYGGVSKAPKFPMPSNYRFLMLYGVENKDREILDFVDQTLLAMAMGGIHDHVGGGFARYAVDERWKVPHFEKMLYDNAQLLELYAEAYVVFNNPFYQEVCTGIINWVERELTGENGLKYSALDADSEGVEGKFYTFDKKELKEILSTDEYNLALWVFKLDDADIWENDRFILERRWSDTDLAEKYECSEADIRSKRQDLYKNLLTYRSGRIRPGLDYKQICSWNALYAGALVKAGVLLDRTEWTRMGEDLFDRVVDTYFQPEGTDSVWYHSKTDDTECRVSGLMEDPIFTLRTASIIADYLGRNERSLWVRSEMKQVVQHFFRPESGNFNMVSSLRSDLIVKPVEVFDSVIPSVNSVAIEILAWLESRFGQTAGLPGSAELLERFMSSSEQYPSAHSHYAIQHMLLNKAKELVITGSEANQWANEVRREQWDASRIFYSTEKVEFEPFLGRFEPNKTAGYICQHRTCGLPIYKLEDLLQTE